MPSPHSKKPFSFTNVHDIQCGQGHSVGSLWTLKELAIQTGIKEALGDTPQGKLALCQVIARLIDPTRRLPAPLLGNGKFATYPLLQVSPKELLQERSLESNLMWVADNRVKIAQKLISPSQKKGSQKLETVFLLPCSVNTYYEEYHLPENRKQNIHFALFCDPKGDLVFAEIYKNTKKGMLALEKKLPSIAHTLGCSSFCIVGEKKFSEKEKTVQILEKEEIQKLFEEGHFQPLSDLSVDSPIQETVVNGTRYLLWYQVSQARQMQNERRKYLAGFQSLVDEYNESPHDTLEHAEKELLEKIRSYHYDPFLTPSSKGQTLSLKIHEEALAKEALLDGYSALKTDLPLSEATKQEIYERYKDVGKIASALRKEKDPAQSRYRDEPVRKPSRKYSEEEEEKILTGHVFILMLAYRIIRILSTACSTAETSVSSAIKDLTRLETMPLSLRGHSPCLVLTTPQDPIKNVLKNLGLKYPKTPEEMGIH